MNAELECCRKEAIPASGGEWVGLDEQEQLEHEALFREEEENRIADLKAKCLRKELDCGAENTKYLQKNERKSEKERVYCSQQNRWDYYEFQWFCR